MNYIKHLNAVCQKFYEDSRLNPTHISLYLALFQFWNLNRFPQIFFIDREETMQLAKIGSKTTYHRGLRNLDSWGYIKYLPSNNPFKGSQVKMPFLWHGGGQVANEHDTASGPSTGQAMVSNTNTFKTNQTDNKQGIAQQPENQNEDDLFLRKKAIQNWKP